MKWMEISVHTTTGGADLVSLQLMQAGALGTEIIDRLDVPDPNKPSGYWELIDQSLIDAMPEDVVVKGWFPMDERLKDRLSALSAQLKELLALTPGFPLGSLALHTTQVDEQDWAECWKKFYKPFRAGRTLVVKPTWEPYEPKPEDKVLEIDPGMAFGTGTHETTALCLGFLEDCITPGMKVLDVGTGSGILAIGAALLGAQNVLAIDIDPTAVRVAKENVTLNRLDHTITAVEGDLLKNVSGTYQLCVANILADVICMLARPVADHLEKDGLFLCSGIIKEREQDVLDALQETGYTLLEKRAQGEWVALLSKKG